ncbi:MAG TPA: efflux RND transporter permease subunit, partial [Polyangiaceae bacterium LLY-WYZ-15_(1-7)]|nr:efflux RND transporter permease subunit [Polyangiaceae bacterium LLY-WYZ-15_(1-7)]
PTPPPSAWERVVGFFVTSKPAVVLLTLLLVAGGLSVAPFDLPLERLGLGGLPRSPVPVDAIPDIGENQQIVFTEWKGHAPADVEDQLTYPLASALLGLQGVKTVRSTSMFGFSSIYVIFDEGIEFYDSRARLLEKLASLPADLLPPDATPTLGPDATALGQVYWYALEGRDADGNLVGGWDLHELRTLQDSTVRPALQAVPGVAEVSSIGGHVAEYQIDVDPDLLRAHGVTLEQVARAAHDANVDVGARTMEINSVEYVVRGLGLLESVADLEPAVVAVREGTPIRLRDVARVGLGPASRRGALDDAGAEIVGGIVVVRYGENPLAVIERVKDAIAELAPGLPRRTLDDGTVSQVTLAPVYDRTGLIHETLGTLSTALWQQLLVTLLVVLVMLRSLRGSVVIGMVLPLGVLFAFGAMRLFGVDANVMALAGIAIAIGTMVDVGIVFAENVQGRLDDARLDARAALSHRARARVVRDAAAEVAPAVLTSVTTTVISFVPVFALTAAEGKLFRPLAWTKTFALIGAFAVALLIVPATAHLLLRGTKPSDPRGGWRRWLTPGHLLDLAIAALVALVLAMDWEPLGPGAGLPLNALFVLLALGLVLGAFALFRRAYPTLLRAFLRRKALFLTLPVALLLFGLLAWRGVGSTFGALGRALLPDAAAEAFPGLRPADVPSFDEGSFLYMPTTTPHASFGAALERLQQMDAAIAEIPEIERVVGKLGRADSTLDPAPVSMFETMIFYRSEYAENEEGERVRQWRDHIRSPDDIWDEIVAAARIPGVTGAPVLQPISTRIVMLQTGMRGRVGLKVRGPDLETLEAFTAELEEALKEVEALNPATVYAERTVGKPYLELVVDREAAAAYGLTVAQIQQTLATAVGGRRVGFALDGRARYPVRV